MAFCMRALRGYSRKLALRVRASEPDLSNSGESPKPGNALAKANAQRV